MGVIPSLKKKKRQNTKMKGYRLIKNQDFSDMILSSSLITWFFFFFASINFTVIMAADLIVYFGKSHIHMV